MPRKWSCRPTTACLYQPPHALRRGIGVRTRRRHLAARACCAPRKRLCRPTTACQYQPPHAPRRGIGVRTRQRHLAACFMAFAVFSKRPTPIIPKSDAIVNRCGGIFYDFFKLVRGRRGNSAFMGSAESGGRNSVTGVKLAVEIRQRLVAAAQRDLQNRQ